MKCIKVGNMEGALKTFAVIMLNKQKNLLTGIYSEEFI
jgi:hypothetical protein